MTNRNHIMLSVGVRLHNKSKPNNYTELLTVDVADIWRERACEYSERPYGHGNGSRTFAAVDETRFTIESQQRPYLYMVNYSAAFKHPDRESYVGCLMETVRRCE